MASNARRALHALQQRMLKAAIETPTPSLELQRDLIEGARRVEVLARQDWTEARAVLAEVQAFREAAVEVLARLDAERRLGAGR